MLALKNKRVIIFAEGKFGPTSSKVATSYLRYCSDDCVAVIDSTKSGGNVEGILGYGGKIPLVSSFHESFDVLKPEVLLIGVGLFSNLLPEQWREMISLALEKGVHVVSGLHFRLADDERFAKLAKQSGSIIWDTKEPPKHLVTSTNKVADINSFVVHTVGSDCRVGKKTTSVEITQCAHQRGIDAGFAATGQSGIYISGSGVAIDAVPADFIAGVSEQLVLSNASHDWVIVEGQGSISHPAYSGVTLGLLHGAMPEALILCHEANLEHHKDWSNIPIRPLNELITVYEQLSSYMRPAKVVAISVNCAGLGKQDAELYIQKVEAETNLPATDVIHFGAEKLVDALVAFQASKQQRKVA